MIKTNNVPASRPGKFQSDQHRWLTHAKFIIQNIRKCIDRSCVIIDEYDQIFGWYEGGKADRSRGEPGITEKLRNQKRSELNWQRRHAQNELATFDLSLDDIQVIQPIIIQALDTYHEEMQTNTAYSEAAYITKLILRASDDPIRQEDLSYRRAALANGSRDRFWMAPIHA